MKQQIRLSDHFTYRKLLQFVFPSIVMMIFTSIYGVVDGLFVSNFAGKTAFAAINLVMPFIMVLGGIGFMIGTGGTALVSKTLGEGRQEEANRYFSMMILFTALLGVLLLLLPQNEKAADSGSATPSAAENFDREALQNEMEDILSSLDGVGKLSLMLTVEGGAALHGCTHRVIGDRIVCATYLCAAAAAGVEVDQNVVGEHGDGAPDVVRLLQKGDAQGEVELLARAE